MFELTLTPIRVTHVAIHLIGVRVKFAPSKKKFVEEATYVAHYVRSISRVLK